MRIRVDYRFRYGGSDSDSGLTNQTSSGLSLRYGYSDTAYSGAGRIGKLGGGQNVGGSGDMLQLEKFENSYFLECYFIHLQEPFKTYFTKNQAIVTWMT